MDNVDFSHNGGMLLFQQSLKFMQDAYSGVISALTSAIGQNCIVSGCVRNGSTVGAGWMIVNGEIMPFLGGNYAAYVTVQETITEKQFNDGQSQPMYSVRVAKMTNVIESAVPFVNFANLKSLDQFCKLPTVASSDYSNGSENVLATINAVTKLKAELANQVPKNSILIWHGSITAIPVGFSLCNGANGTPDLRGRFVLGAGGTYAVNAVGGEEKHQLTIDEMPAHSHGYTLRTIANADGNDNQRGVQGTTTAQTSSQGGDQAHNNMPPYYALAFIKKIV